MSAVWGKEGNRLNNCKKELLILGAMDPSCRLSHLTSINCFYFYNGRNNVELQP